MENKSPMSKPEPFKCIICDELVTKEYGNNPWPVKDSGKCCDSCNFSAVIPARIDLYTAG